MAKIELDHVTYTYPGQPGAAPVLRDLSLTIGDGEFVCIVGASGCGKTTLLRLMAGLTFPTAGAVRIGGGTVTGPGTDRSIVFQNYTLFPWMTARRNVEFGIRQARPGRSRAEIRGSADAVLRQVGMLDSADKYPFQLSGGMRQRVAIARALAMDTDIVLLDEPFGALDTRIRGELQILLETVHMGRKTVVFVTHDIHEAVLLADRVLYMTSGMVSYELPIRLPRPRSRLDAAGLEQVCACRRALLARFQPDSNATCGCGEVSA